MNKLLSLLLCFLVKDGKVSDLKQQAFFEAAKWNSIIVNTICTCAFPTVTYE